ncbi:MAG: hypothetical protein M3N16_00450 [Actinomycetota bacterium]|nr:hypothetical protein [Actinomycetota bacterium]
MAEIERHTTIRRWKGSLSDIADVARLVESLTGTSGDDLERGEALRVTVEYRGEGRDKFDSVDEFEENVLPANLRGIDSVSIASGRVLSPRVRVTVRFSRTGAGVIVNAEGGDLTAVEGARQRLTSRLAPGARRGGRWLGGAVAWPLFALGGGAVLGSMFQVLIAQEEKGKANDEPVLAIIWLAFAGLSYLLAFVAALGGWLVPRLELLEPGAKTRWRRWRGVVMAAFILPLPSALAPLLIELL